MTRTRTTRGPELVGILLIAIGLVFLLRTTGVLRVGWDELWALVLISIGGIIVLGAVWRPASRGAKSIAVPLESADRLDLRLRLGAGTFRVTGSVEPGVLVRVDSTDDDVDAGVRREGSLTRLTLNRDPGWWFGGWPRGGGEWRIGVSDDVRTRLDLAAGAGDFGVDLLPLQVAEASISVGAAQLRVRLPQPAGDVPVRISAGAASVTIEVPAGVEAKVVTSGLLSVEGRNETAGYAAATDRVSVRVDGGLASVRIA